jgi:hypothetical protein
MQQTDHERPPSEVIEVFVQVEGKSPITIVRISGTATVNDLIEEAVRLGLVDPAHRGQVVGLLEDIDDELRPTDRLDIARIGHRSRVHFHRCRRIEVTVHFNGGEKQRTFSPSATIAKVTEWAVGKHGFNLTPTDAVEHVLQIGGSPSRPDEDVHLGTLTSFPNCVVSFDLVPKRRVEG